MILAASLVEARTPIGVNEEGLPARPVSLEVDGAVVEGVTATGAVEISRPLMDARCSDDGICTGPLSLAVDELAVAVESIADRAKHDMMKPVIQNIRARMADLNGTLGIGDCPKIVSVMLRFQRLPETVSLIQPASRTSPFRARSRVIFPYLTRPGRWAPARPVSTSATRGQGGGEVRHAGRAGRLHPDRRGAGRGEDRAGGRDGRAGQVTRKPTIPLCGVVGFSLWRGIRRGPRQGRALTLDEAIAAAVRPVHRRSGFTHDRLI